MWYTYILKSSIKKWYYVGSTNRIGQRLREHNLGKVSSTKAYRPFVLIYKKVFNIESEARKYERFLKDKRIEKEKIIREFENNKDCPIV